MYLNLDFSENFSEKSRQAPPKISLRQTQLEGFCPPREQPICSPIFRRYRTHDGTCNNARKARWGSAQMPFNRFLGPAYTDGIEELRQSVEGGPLPSARFISLLVHGSRDSESPVTLMLAQWGQFIDHDLTSTAQPRSINGTVPQCCGVSELHPSCSPIKVPRDDPWLAPLGVRCLEFLRSAPSQRRDCLLSWREQTNQVTSYLDASPIYSSNERNAERSRVFSNGLLLFGQGPPREDVCLRGALSPDCIRSGDTRNGEQPGLLALHHTWVLEHNHIATELSEMNLHWSDEKIYQETRRIVGAMVQHITYREFLPLVLGRDVCKLFDLELESTGYFTRYDVRANPTVSNAFAAAAFRFGHSLIQNTYLRSTRNHQIIDNNVTLHDENAKGDIGGPGSLQRLLRGLAIQRAQKRDEFITAELTNHLFQSGTFPFGLDLAAINIQRGRDHGLPAYTKWREPCGLSPITDWNDLERVVGPLSTRRIQSGYRSVDDIDLFVGGLAERPVVGGLVGPVFACIIAQQFSNLRKGDRFWYENGGFESSFTPAQLQSIRQVSFAQVVCRALGSGTLQPHIFLPHTVSTNERILCDTGSLVPIDLKPWLERDPFIKDLQKDAFPTKNITSANNGNTNRATVFRKQFLEGPLVTNGAFVDNKLDLKRPLDRINDKINVLNATPPTRTTDKRKKNRKTLRRPSAGISKKTTTTVRPTRRAAIKMKHRLRKNKRDVSQNDKARGAIFIKIDKPTNDEQTTKKTPFSSKRKMTTDKEYIILTPDQTAYDIEIKIKPSTKRTQSATIQKIVTIHQPSNGYFGPLDDDVTTTKRPQHFYNMPQPTLADSGSYGVGGGVSRPQQVHNDATSRPNYHGIITKRPTVAYGSSFDDDVTARPYYSTKRPTYNYETAQDDDDNRPFYNYPTVQQADQSSYYATQSDSTHQQDDYATAIMQNRPNNRPTFNDDQLQKPSYGYRPPVQADSGYANRPISDSNYASRPIYLDDFETTPLPIRLTTTYSYAKPIKIQTPNTGHAGYYGSTTNRPHDLMTFYTVMTTKKRKRTRPTSPMTYNQQDDENDDDDSDDTTWNPTAVISNIVNTFSDYFGSPATSTRKPYIQNDDEEDDFYTYPSFPQQSFLYSRQKDGQTVDTHVPQQITTSTTATTSAATKKVTSAKRRIDTTLVEDQDYETITYRAAHKSHTGLNIDVTEDDDKSSTFDRDGYLRPEYMKYDGLKHNDTNTFKNDMTQTIRNESPRRPKQFLFLSNTNQNRQTQIRNPSGLVPLNVLTKPERPDNWVMFDAMHKVPLPTLPTLKWDFGENSSEMPRPIIFNRN